MFIFSDRIKRENITVKKMIILYCKDKHNSNVHLCVQCQNITEYADKKLDKCVFGDEKPICADCPVHCYRKDEREYIKEIMRYAGPRMIFKHPIMAIMHIIDKKISKKNNLKRKKDE